MARLEAGDVGEDEAARRAGAGDRRARTCVSKSRSPAAAISSPSAPACWSSIRRGVDRVNEVDETLTVATLPPWKRGRGRRDDRHREDHPLRRARTRRCDAAVAAARTDCIAVAPFRPLTGRRRLDDSARTQAVRHRQDAARHERAARAAAAAQIVVRPARRRTIAPALARRDRDAAPQARSRSSCSAPPPSPTGATSFPPPLVAAGGQIEHLGMPVDPGNLLLVGTHRAASR